MKIDIFGTFKNILEHLKLIVILKSKSTTAGFETGTQDSD